MTASKLLNAAIHALAPGALSESFVGDDSSVGQLIPGAMHLPVEGMLPSFDGATGWLNSDPLTPAGLRGRVVVVDFWTYTCINWLRTLPYVRAWAERYREQGMVVIGVHTPEFPFEHERENVRRAAQEMRVEYPIAIDSDYGVWDAFDNHYWPALYFVDAQGQIRHHQFGEGSYEQSEMVIQQLLAEAGKEVGQQLTPVEGQGIEAQADWDDLQSPETYLGYGRGDSFASPGGAYWDRPSDYTIPDRLQLNEWALSGNWTIQQIPAVLNRANGKIAYRFHARDLHLVLAPPAGGSPARFRVSLDGRAPGEAHGADVDEQGNGTVSEPRLYQLVRQQGPITDRTFELELLDSGVGAYVFTFG